MENQPLNSMDTAPTDGTYIYVFSENGEGLDVALARYYLFGFCDGNITDVSGANDGAIAYPLGWWPHCEPQPMLTAPKDMPIVILKKDGNRIYGWTSRWIEAEAMFAPDWLPNDLARPGNNPLNDAIGWLPAPLTN